MSTVNIKELFAKYRLGWHAAKRRALLDVNTVSP
jgi:hypothetical protein